MSLPTPFELSALAMLAKLLHSTRYPTALQTQTALEEASCTWDKAGHRLGQIAAKQDPRSPGRITPPLVFPCPSCHQTMSRTSDYSWACHTCKTLWSLMEQGAEPEV